MELTHLFDYYASPGYCTECVGVNAATQLVPTRQHLDADESVDVVILPLDEAAEMVRRGEIQDGKTIAALMSIWSQNLI